MKNKILNVIILLGIVGIGVGVALLINGIFEASSLGFQYIILGGLFVSFLGLNFRFRKRTDVEEAIFSMRRSRRMVARIQPNTDVRFVQLSAIKNQLANAEIDLNDVIARYDLYNLKSLSDKLGKAKKHYMVDDDLKSTFTSSELKEDLRIIDQLIKELELLKK